MRNPAISVMISLSLICVSIPICALGFTETAGKEETATLSVSAAEKMLASGGEYDDSAVIAVFDDEDITEAEVVSSIESETALDGSCVSVEVVGEASDSSYAAVEIPDDKSAAEVMSELSKVDGVAYVQPDFVYTVAGSQATNDPDTGDEYYLYATHAADLYSEMKTGGKVTVAVLDTGCLLSHTDLKANISPYAYDAYLQKPLSQTDGSKDLYGHGTQTAGAMGAVADNGTLGAGVSYNATILPIKVSPGSKGTMDTIAIARGLRYIENLIEEGKLTNLKAINMSFGIYSTESHGDYIGLIDDSFADTTLHGLICELRDTYGVLTVAAGGNGENGVAQTKAFYPSDWPEVLSVTATNKKNTNVSWSNYNSAKDLSAPGKSIFTTSADGKKATTTNDGTSFSAPIVCGIAALLWSAYPDATVDEVVAALKATATPVYDSKRTARTTGSAGLVDAVAAYNHLKALYPSGKAAAKYSIKYTADPDVSVAYTGKAKTPNIKVLTSYAGTTLKKGIDYEIVSYSGNVTCGYGKVKIRGLGSYTGCATLRFQIRPRKAKVKSVTSTPDKIHVTVKKAKGTGYQYVVYEKKSCTEESINDWKTVKSNKKTSVTFEMFTKGKKYWVRVRAYKKTSDGRKVWGKWSKVKAIRAK